MDLKKIQELINTRTKNQIKKENDEKFKLIVKNNLNEVEHMIELLIDHFLDLDNFCRSIVETNCEKLKKHMLD